MGTVVAGLMVVSLSVCAALAGYLAVQRRWAAALRKQHNDVAGFIYAVIGIAVRATAPQTAREQVLFDHALSVHQSLQDSRRLRLFQSRLGVQPILWVVLITGGVLTVAFTYLFGLASTRAHALMITALAAT